MTVSKSRTRYMSFATMPFLLFLATIMVRHLAMCCTFPSSLNMDARDPPWYSHVRSDGSRDVEYYIRHTVMEIHYPGSTQPAVRWKCSMHFQGKSMLKRQDHQVNNFYRCVKFVFRSRSVVQIMWSHEIKIFDLGLCDDANLILDPWPLIWYGTLEEDYTPCPFNGGFDMKIIDSKMGENGCNLMLRPMRMEVECLEGEGVNFNFVSSNCLPDIKMYVRQRTICVTGWQDNRNHYVILRRDEDKDMWCLVMPRHLGHNSTAYLFSDLTCRSDTEKFQFVTDIKFFTLMLHTRLFPTICEDEYDHCSKVTCNTYVKQECQKSCGMCNASSLPLQCEYPRHFRGKWFLKDSFGHKTIDISTSDFSIGGTGSFQCRSFPNSTSRKSTLYTAVSLYPNGCRPRYTCLNIKQIGPSVLQFSLSQSFVWPIFDSDLGKSICSEDRFHADSSPIDDRYRSHEGTGKPIISQIPKPELVPCNLTSLLTINASLPEGYICPGRLYQHCEDPRKLRLEFDTCGSLVPASRDYKCLANFQGHYWERILLVQNVHDDTDAVCFVFSQFYPIESYVLVASQCDQKSFNFARTGLRQPTLKFTFRTEQDTCKSVSITPQPPRADLADPSAVLADSDSSMRDESRKNNTQTNLTHRNSNSQDSMSIDSDSHPKKGMYNNIRESFEVPSAKSTSLDRANLLRSGEDTNKATSVISCTGWTLLLTIVWLYCS